MTLIVASYLSPRPEEHGDRAHSYGEALQLLDASCAIANCRHVVITEEGSVDAIPASIDRDRVFVVEGTRNLPLMKAIIAGQMAFVSESGVADEGTILVGADCLVMRDPRPVFANADWDVAVTVGVYSPGGLNNGAVYLAPGADAKALVYYQLAHMNCPPEWGGDQHAVRMVCMPLEKPPITVNRHGMRVRFLDMDGYNCPPACAEDHGASKAYVAHFKGERKRFMADFSARFLGVTAPDDAAAGC